MCHLFISEGTTGLTEEGEPLNEISMVQMQVSPPPPEGANIIGLIYDFGPDGATFDPPVTITFTYEESLIPEDVSEENLVIAIWDSAAGEWVMLESCVVDQVNHTITAPVSHLTLFALIAKLAPTPTPQPPTPTLQAVFEISNLSITPTETIVGKPVTITFEITNSGGAEGSYIVDLNIDGVAGATTEVTLAPGDSKMGSYTIIRNWPGTYHVTLNGLSGEFSLSLPLIYWLFTAILIIAALLGGIVIRFNLARRKKQPFKEKPSKAKQPAIRLPKFKLPKLKLKLPWAAKAPETTQGKVKVKAEQVATTGISITELQIMPEVVTPGSSVGITATVANSSQTTAQYKVELKINDEVKDFQEVTLAPGERRQVAFIIAAGAHGEYQIGIDDLTGKLSVGA